MASRNKAFTLIELLAVIAIIGILAGFIFAAVDRAIDRARVSKTANSIKNLGIALSNYERDVGSFEAEVGDKKETMPTGLINPKPSGDQDRIKIMELLNGKKLNPDGTFKIDVDMKTIREDPRWDGPYFDPKPKDLQPKNTQYKKGQLVDTWGNPIMIRIKKGNYDDRMRYKPDSFEIYSWGPNERDETGKGDDITDWD